MQHSSQSVTDRTHPADTPFIAADVGGTHARVGLVSAPGVDGQPVRLLRYEKYACAHFAGLSDILREFVAVHAPEQVHCGSIACAGYPAGDTVVNTNLPWPVSIHELREALGLRELALINDFQAMAHATPYLDARDAVVLAPGVASPHGPVLVVGPGTGLGAALRIPTTGGRSVVLATEAGQAAFAPTTEREVAVVGRLLQRTEYVSIEHLLSGPGLVTLYRVLGELDGTTPALEHPAEITAAALAGHDARALDALQTFCGLMGSVIGDLVLLYGAQGGVYLAGGILPQIRGFLQQSSFIERFFSKGAMRSVLAQVPVRLIEHGHLGVIGAAIWFVDNRPGN